MGDKIQEEIDEVLDTLSLTDFPTTHHQDHRNPPPPPPSPPPAGEFFEFFRGDFSDEKVIMCHAEDIIFCLKLLPINEQRKKPLPQTEKPHHHRRRRIQPIPCHWSESMSEVKTAPATSFLTTSRSLVYKKLQRNSSMSTSKPAPEIGREGFGKKSSSSSRWYLLLFGLVKVPPPKMDLRDIKNRQIRRMNSKMVVSSSDSGEVVPVNRSDEKCSWRVLGFLSCKSLASAAVTMPLRYVARV